VEVVLAAAADGVHLLVAEVVLVVAEVRYMY
jgi:hypothetical protein